MKFICLGYIEPGKFEGMSEADRNSMVDSCLQYDDQLRISGALLGGDALQGPSTAKTLRWENGAAVAIDGPYAETKEQIGGILYLEAKDIEHAVKIMKQHPGVKAGPFEIRPVADVQEMIAASEQRRNKVASA